MVKVIDNVIIVERQDAFQREHDLTVTEGSVQFKSLNHYIMWRKAKLFGDTRIQSIFESVGMTLDNSDFVKFGRKVVGFSEQTWLDNIHDILVDGFVHQLEQHQSLSSGLLKFTEECGGDIEVYFDTREYRYGIGDSDLDYEEADEIDFDHFEYNGDNLLGLAFADALRKVADVKADDNDEDSYEEVNESVDALKELISEVLGTNVDDIEVVHETVSDEQEPEESEELDIVSTLKDMLVKTVQSTKEVGAKTTQLVKDKVESNKPFQPDHSEKYVVNVVDSASGGGIKVGFTRVDYTHFKNIVNKMINDSTYRHEKLVKPAQRYLVTPIAGGQPFWLHEVNTVSELKRLQETL